MSFMNYGDGRGEFMYKPPYVIAEAGCNHMGQMEIAHEMITTAAIF